MGGMGAFLGAGGSQEIVVGPDNKDPIKTGARIARSCFGSRLAALALWLQTDVVHTMTDFRSQQDLLGKAWTGGRNGTLSAMSEAKAWALREAWRAQGNGDWGVITFASERVLKIGGGNPGEAAISKFFKKVDSESEWFPGKSNQTQFGPDPALTGQAKNAIAQAAMAMKKRKIEPTFPRILAACPQAVVNPDTGKPVGKKRIYDVFRALCYDEDPVHPWSHRTRFSKKALTEVQMEKRLECAHAVQELRHTAKWYFDKVVYTDICNSILPKSETKAEEQVLARKAGKGWLSAGCEMSSGNLRGGKESIKMNSWDTERVWWTPILACGKLHVEVLPENFPGEEPDGATILVQKLRAALNVRFQGGGAPTVVWTDRGKGFFHGNGKITAQFKAALEENGLKHFWKDDAAIQPGQLHEVHLHETAVSWIRYQLTLSTPNNAWKETREQYTSRLKACCAEINKSYDVDSLRRALPRRIEALIESEGDRINK